MESFAKEYYKANQDGFAKYDTIYILSFSIIMLNTDLHNPAVKEKITTQQFISINKGINNGEDLPANFLISIYNSIKNEPFKIPDDKGNDLMITFFNPDKKAWLWKKSNGALVKKWSPHWFILKNNCLYYFSNDTDKAGKSLISWIRRL